MIITLPIPGFVSVVGPAVLRFPGDGIQLPPGGTPGSIELSLFLFGKLLIGNEFFHHRSSLLDFMISVSEIFGKRINDL